MPDEDEAQAEGQLKTPKKTTITVPPSAPKETSAGTSSTGTSNPNHVQVHARDQALTKGKRRSSCKDKLSQVVRFPKRRRNHLAKTPTMAG
jgi:hypothetical protein